MVSAVQSQAEAGLVFSRRVYRPGTVLAPHTHEHAYVSFVGSGSYRERVGRVVRECDCSSLLFHPAGERHENAFDFATVELLRVEAAGSSVLDLLEPGFVGRQVVASRLCRKMLLELRAPDSLTPLVLHGLTLELVGEVAREAVCPRWVLRVDEVLCCSLAAVPSLGELAAVAGVHPVHLCRAYRRYRGQTIGERVRELRVSRACELLRGELPVGEIALACGFCDQSHLARTTRALLGVSPSEYRRRVK